MFTFKPASYSVLYYLLLFFTAAAMDPYNQARFEWVRRLVRWLMAFGSDLRFLLRFFCSLPSKFLMIEWLRTNFMWIFLRLKIFFLFSINYEAHFWVRSKPVHQLALFVRYFIFHFFSFNAIASHSNFFLFVLIYVSRIYLYIIMLKTCTDSIKKMLGICWSICIHRNES